MYIHIFINLDVCRTILNGIHSHSFSPVKAVIGTLRLELSGCTDIHHSPPPFSSPVWLAAKGGELLDVLAATSGLCRLTYHMTTLGPHRATEFLLKLLWGFATPEDKMSNGLILLLS